MNIYQDKVTIKVQLMNLKMNKKRKVNKLRIYLVIRLKIIRKRKLKEINQWIDRENFCLSLKIGNIQEKVKEWQLNKIGKIICK